MELHLCTNNSINGNIKINKMFFELLKTIVFNASVRRSVWQHGLGVRSPFINNRWTFPTAFDSCTSANTITAHRSEGGQRCHTREMFVWHTSCWMFCSTVTTFLAKPFQSPAPLWPHTNQYDPPQIGMTCAHSIPPIIYCANATASPEESNMHTWWQLFNHLDTLCSTSSYCFCGGKSFDLLFSRGERKVGFPFSNFYLPCWATATKLLPVNLPIIAHMGEKECVCVCVSDRARTAHCPYVLAVVTHVES